MCIYRCYSCGLGAEAWCCGWVQAGRGAEWPWEIRGLSILFVINSIPSTPAEFLEISSTFINSYDVSSTSDNMLL